MTIPVFVLRDDAGILHSCQANAEKVFCDGCGEEIDPRLEHDLCFSCRKEAEAYKEED